MQAAYDGIASRYAAQNAQLAAVLVPRAEQVCARVAERLLLDLGCGTGRDLAWFTTAGVRVIGMDLSGGMLREACHQAAVPLVQADLATLPVADAVLGGIWCVAALLHVPDEAVDGALREMRRVLMTGGVLYLGLAEGEGQGWERGPYADEERFFAYHQAEELRGRLERAGFRVDAQSTDHTPRRRWIGLLATAS
jgi:SAM-dependent methyltransferase